jgi:hypothetical protein
MDVFAAAVQVSPAGSVTGVDITPSRRARRTSAKYGARSVSLLARKPHGASRQSTTQEVAP